MTPLVLMAGAAVLNCWVQAGQQYKLPPYLLSSIAMVESTYNPNAVAHPPDGTRSIGLMQVNSWWLPTLATYGVTEQDLYDPCTNVQVGAWILSQEVERFGYTWRALGSYYAGPKGSYKDFKEYSDKVLMRWRQSLAGEIEVGRIVEQRSEHDRRQRRYHYIGDMAAVHVAESGN